MKNYIYKGYHHSFRAPVEMKSGLLYSLGNGDIVVGAQTNALVGEIVTVTVCGVIEIPKVDTEAYAFGDILHFDPDNEVLTSDTNVGFFAGYAVESYDSGSTVARVKISD